MPPKIEPLLETYTPGLLEKIYAHRMLITRYLFSGGLATATDLVGIYFFTDIVGFHYLSASIVAFIIAFCVSFTMQKYWTFKDHGHDDIHKQLGIFLGVSLANLVLNTLLMKLFVDVFGVWYLLAQLIVAGLIAIMSFFIYRLVIFRKPKKILP